MSQARNFLLPFLIIIVSVLMVMWVWNWKNTEESDEPKKPIPAQNKTLGSLTTHVVPPQQRRENVSVPDSDPEILVTVKTATIYHKKRLSLLLFTWFESIPLQQVQK